MCGSSSVSFGNKSTFFRLGAIMLLCREPPPHSDKAPHVWQFICFLSEHVDILQTWGYYVGAAPSSQTMKVMFTNMEDSTVQ